METYGGVFCSSPSMAAENHYSYQFPQENCRCRGYEYSEENWSAIDDNDVYWEEFLKKLDIEGHEMIKKFVTKVEESVPVEEILKETWHHFRGKPAASHMLEKIARKMGRAREGSSVMRERDIGGDDLQGEMKNERFKVKIMNDGSGVVKEEGRSRNLQKEDK